MIEGFIRGLRARRPALFNLYTSCQPEHGIADDVSTRQAKLAVESRAYPLFRYDPAGGATPQACFDLQGNPALEADWPTYTLTYRDGDAVRQMELPLTFADFALTEVRFRKHFRAAPPDTWSEAMVPLADFLALDAEARGGRFPYVWTVGRDQALSRLLVDQVLVASCEDRRAFWTMLRALAGHGAASREALEQEVREEVVGKVVAGILQLAGGAGDGLRALAGGGAAPAPVSGGPADYLAPWLDSDACTACDECMKINPKIFAYNANHKAHILNADAGPYRDLVLAAEKCTAQVIHPGLPRRRDDKDVEKWIARATPFN
jgi:pyruvate-ferredoxin/flavodoxin oxidoreductase